MCGNSGFLTGNRVNTLPSEDGQNTYTKPADDCAHQGIRDAGISGTTDALRPGEARTKWWRGVWNGKIPGGIQAGDLAVSAIEAALIGDPDQGGRHWDTEKDPNLMNFLRDIIDSKASHLVDRAENAREREPHPAEGESESEFLDRKRDHRTLPDEGFKVSADEESANERLFFALLDEVKNDPLLPKILECKWDGICGRAEIAAKLDVDANAITQAQKRLDRILPQFREKYSHLNPFKTR